MGLINPIWSYPVLLWIRLDKVEGIFHGSVSKKTYSVMFPVYRNVKSIKVEGGEYKIEISKYVTSLRQRVWLKEKGERATYTDHFFMGKGLCCRMSPIFSVASLLSHPFVTLEWHPLLFAGQVLWWEREDSVGPVEWWLSPHPINHRGGADNAQRLSLHPSRN